MERLQRIVVDQPSVYIHSDKPIKSKIPMWTAPRMPTETERDWIIKSAVRRHQDPQPGSGIEFGNKLVVAKERAIIIGSVPVRFFRRKVEEIDLTAAPSESVADPTSRMPNASL